MKEQITNWVGALIIIAIAAGLIVHVANLSHDMSAGHKAANQRYEDCLADMQASYLAGKDTQNDFMAFDPSKCNGALGWYAATPPSSSSSN